ncbi:MAG: LPD28 domain-containing protein [Eisenbergiella sp.]
MEERTDAGQWLYERAELDGMEVWGTGAALDHSSVPDGLYCYNLYGTGEPEDFAHNFISKEPVEKDCVGAVLSAQPLPFQGKESMGLGSLHFLTRNRCVPCSRLPARYGWLRISSNRPDFKCRASKQGGKQYAIYQESNGHRRNLHCAVPRDLLCRHAAVQSEHQ